MKRIIEEVLHTEEKVSTLLKQARAKAAEIRGSADRELSGMTSEAREKAREMIQTAAQEARKDAERHKEEELKRADQENDALLEGNAETIDRLVDAICQIVVTTAEEKDPA